MARSPSSDSGQENYLFAAVGVGDQMGNLTVQTENTLNGASVYEPPPWPSADAELRLCRTGSQFSLYKRTVGAGTWTLAATYKRADLPANAPGRTQSQRAAEARPARHHRRREVRARLR